MKYSYNSFIISFHYLEPMKFKTVAFEGLWARGSDKSWIENQIRCESDKRNAKLECYTSNNFKFHLKVQSETRVVVDHENAFNNYLNFGKLTSFGDEILWSDGTSWQRKSNNY